VRWPNFGRKDPCPELDKQEGIRWREGEWSMKWGTKPKGESCKGVQTGSILMKLLFFFLDVQVHSAWFWPRSDDFIWISLLVKRCVFKNWSRLYKKQNLGNRQMPSVDTVPCGAGWATVEEGVLWDSVLLCSCSFPWEPDTTKEGKINTDTGACAVGD
jgi:hypothetical protein